MNMCNLVRLLAPIALLADTSSASTCGKAAPAGMRLVALGDSTTFGYEVHDGYPLKLARRLAELKVPVTIINSGVNGDTTSGARERFARDVLAHDPDWAIIQFGLNDQTIRLYQQPEEITPYVSQEEFAGNPHFFISQLRSRGVRIILMTPNLMCWTPTLERHYPDGPYLDHPDGGNALLKRYAEIVRRIARQEKTLLVDVLQAYEDYADTSGHALEELFLPDGVHPNERGYEITAELILQTILPVLNRKEATSRPAGRSGVAVVQDGVPVTSYITGRGCRRGADYLELTRIVHERNPRDSIVAPVALGEGKWSMKVEMAVVPDPDLEMSVLLDDNGRIAFSSQGAVMQFTGSLFDLPAEGKITGFEGFMCSSEPFTLELIRREQRLIVKVNGKTLHVVPLRKGDMGSAGMAVDHGTIRIHDFVVHQDE